MVLFFFFPYSFSTDNQSDNVDVLFPVKSRDLTVKPNEQSVLSVMVASLLMPIRLPVKRSTPKSRFKRVNSYFAQNEQDFLWFLNREIDEDATMNTFAHFLDLLDVTKWFKSLSLQLNGN